METFSRMSPEQRANLTAYLDGELDEVESADIERVLSRSSVARNDVEVLARTYDLLDNLPRYQATTAFTERTIASIRLELSRPDISQTLCIARRSAATGRCCGACCCLRPPPWGT